MSVLELDEESRSLREAARAWGRGELGVDDYRMIRRATLEGKLGLEPGSSLDEAAEAVPVAGDPDDDTEVVGSVPVDPPPAASPGMLITGALITALVLVLLGFLLL